MLKIRDLKVLEVQIADHFYHSRNIMKQNVEKHKDFTSISRYDLLTYIKGKVMTS